MAVAFSFIRPDEMWSLSATVSTTAGTTDTTYTDDWLVDGRSGRPAKATTGTVTWSLAAAAGLVGGVAVVNHNIDAARTITIGGGVSASLSGPALPADGIQLNPFALVTETSITTLTVAVASNSVPVIIGELVAGKVRTCRPFTFMSASVGQRNYQGESEARSITLYSEGRASRTYTGTQYYTTAVRDALIDLYESTRGNSRPVLLIPDATVQDAWWAKLVTLEYAPFPPLYWRVTFTFQELPRERW